MLDTIQYTQSNGTWIKTVTSISTVADVNAEVAALQAQLDDFALSQETDPSSEVASAIANYEAQLALLKGN